MLQTARRIDRPRTPTPLRTCRDLYINAADVDAFRSQYPADPNADDANVVLRNVENPIAFDGEFVPPVVAVLDLLDAGDTRASAEALRILR